MIRRLNFTSRINLPRNAVRIRIKEDYTFDATWLLERWKFPGNSEVFLEAYSSGVMSLKRFPYGTVDKPMPGLSNRDLSDFADSVVKFNFKVVEKGEFAGRILGVASEIPALKPGEIDSGLISILPVNPVDLGPEIWRINFECTPRPWLEVNNQIPDILSQLKTNEGLFSLMYPQVIREILAYILLSEKIFDAELMDSSWQTEWLTWAVLNHPDKDKPVDLETDKADEANKEWIEEVVRQFCITNNVRAKFEDFFCGGQK